MSNFIYYEKLEDYEEQVRKAKLCDEKDKEIERLNKKIRILRENADYNDKLVDKVNWENKRLDNIINAFAEELKWQRKVSLSSNEGFAVSRIDILINKLQELKGSAKA